MSGLTKDQEAVEAWLREHVLFSKTLGDNEKTLIAGNVRGCISSLGFGSTVELDAFRATAIDYIDGDKWEEVLAEAKKLAEFTD